MMPFVHAIGSLEMGSNVRVVQQSSLSEPLSLTISSQGQGEVMPSQGWRGKVCVTGAGGFIASWLVKQLVERGYSVIGTLRNPDDVKNSHLHHLQAAATGQLTLIKADLMDYSTLLHAFHGCHGVFHLACPVNEDPAIVLGPAIQGTLNVLHACAESEVKRVIFTSSFGAVYMDPKRDPTALVDESCWSSLDYCKATKNWYCYGKTMAEQAAWEKAKGMNLDLVVINPSLVLGPRLQPSLNASTMHILKYLTGSAKTYANLVQAYVDVRDVAEACILLYETPSSSGRYLCAESVLHRGDVVEILAKMFPQYPIPTKCSDQISPRETPYPVSNRKLTDLGFIFTPIKQCLYETVVNMQDKGVVPL